MEKKHNGLSYFERLITRQILNEKNTQIYKMKWIYNISIAFPKTYKSCIQIKKMYTKVRLKYSKVCTKICPKVATKYITKS